MSRFRTALQSALLLLGLSLLYVAVTQEPDSPRLPAPAPPPLLYVGLWVGVAAAALAAYWVGKAGKKDGR